MDKDRELQQRARRVLQRQQPSAAARAKLRAARLAALDSGSRPRQRSWMPATALGSLLLALGGLLLYQQLGEVELPQSAVEDLALIAGEDDLELFEDLEFYVWLEQEERG